MDNYNPWAERHCSHKNATITQWFEDGGGMMRRHCPQCGSINSGPVIAITEPSDRFPAVGLYRYVLGAEVGK